MAFPDSERAQSASATDASESVALRSGDGDAFRVLVRRHERRLHLHCYRMLGSLDEADDLVQETLLRAWRARETFDARSSVSTWLHRIATNVCLNALERRPKRVLPNQIVPPNPDPGAPLAAPMDAPWLQPYPDRWLDALADQEPQPDEAVIERETIEFVFLLAIQQLPPRQRAALLLRDVLGWSAKETASSLDVSVASANSALQRARATLREQLPGRGAGAASADPSELERAVVRRYVDAVQQRDFGEFARLLHHDIQLVMPPTPTWYRGRDQVVAFMQRFAAPTSGLTGATRVLETGANRQPALAFYLGQPGESRLQPTALNVLRIDASAVVEIAAFPAEVFPAFGLPTTL